MGTNVLNLVKGNKYKSAFGVVTYEGTYLAKDGSILGYTFKDDELGERYILNQKDVQETVKKEE